MKKINIPILENFGDSEIKTINDKAVKTNSFNLIVNWQFD